MYDEDLRLFKRVKRVTVDGVDVVNDTFLADDEKGIVLRYVRDPETKGYYIDPKTKAPAIELLKGKVEIFLDA